MSTPVEHLRRGPQGGDASVSSSSSLKEEVVAGRSSPVGNQPSADAQSAPNTGATIRAGVQPGLDGNLVGIGRISRDEPSAVALEAERQQAGQVSVVVNNGVAVDPPKVGGCGPGGCAGCNACKFSEAAKNIDLNENARVQAESGAEALSLLFGLDSAAALSALQTTPSATTAAAEAIIAVASGVVAGAKESQQAGSEKSQEKASASQSTKPETSKAESKAASKNVESRTVAASKDAAPKDAARSSNREPTSRVSSSSQSSLKSSVASAPRENPRATSQTKTTARQSAPSSATSPSGASRSQPSSIAHGTHVRQAVARTTNSAHVHLSNQRQTQARSSQTSVSVAGKGSSIGVRGERTGSIVKVIPSPGTEAIAAVRSYLARLALRARGGQQETKTSQRQSTERSKSVSRRIETSRRVAMPAPVRVRTERVVTQASTRLNRLASKIEQSQNARGRTALVERASARAVKLLDRTLQARGLSAQTKGWLQGMKTQVVGLQQALKLTRGQPALRAAVEKRLAGLLKEISAGLESRRATGKLLATRAERPRLRIPPRKREVIAKHKAEPATRVRTLLRRGLARMSEIYQMLSPSPRASVRIKPRHRKKMGLRKQTKKSFVDELLEAALEGAIETQPIGDAARNTAPKKVLVSGGASSGAQKAASKQTGGAPSVDGGAPDIVSALAGGPKAELNIDIVKNDDDDEIFARVQNSAD